ncbi:MAG TPA: N-acetylmuramoyl-L-alanine amidase [Chthoniobacteraceae bacterium]
MPRRALAIFPVRRWALVVAAAMLLSGCASHSGRNSAPAGLNVQQMLVPEGRFARRKEFPLRASYITIHSTSNRGATALQHARGLRNGAFRGRSRWNRTGYVSWHFTVDDQQSIQSLPLNIQGEHADHEGPGNRSSIAIEICEFSDRRKQAAAVDRAARLTAWLMREKGIPLARVVPHYHWPQHHFRHYQKPCPRILMDGGRPGAKWAAFLRRVRSYR